MYIRNTWYVAAEPQEVPPGKILARTILNERVALYRTGDGRVVAVEDVCPHRYAPLHMGRLEGNAIRCPYHGSVFDEHGKCREVPGQTGSHGMDARIKVYPTVERHQFIWIWMGDPALAHDQSSIPEWFSPSADLDGDWQGRHARFLSLPVYYEIINDNLHDVSHVEFVHPETLGVRMIPEMYRMKDEDMTADRYVERIVEDTYMQRDFHARNTRGGPILHQALAYRHQRDRWDDNIDWHLTVRYSNPSNFSFLHRSKPVDAPPAEGVWIDVLNHITPETDASCHYFFYSAHNLHASGPERQAAFTQICADGVVFAFEQDMALLTEQAARAPNGGRDAQAMAKVSFMGDMVPALGRRMIQRQLDRERAAAGDS